MILVKKLHFLNLKKGIEYDNMHFREIVFL